MRTYSKPVVEIENFRLDAQFASGGCAAVAEDSYEVVAATSEINDYLSSGFDEDNLWGTYPQLAEFMEKFGLNKGTISGSLQNYIDKYAYWIKVEGIGFTVDNLNSGGCYFTFINASGKGFS